MRGEERSGGPPGAEEEKTPTLRLFVAFALPDEVRATMKRRLSKLRAQLPGTRWVDPDHTHLTLVFLGHHPEERRAGLEAALGEVFARYPSMRLRLHGGGTFGRPARVAWVGVKAPPTMQPLQRDVTDAAASVLGFEPEKRPFSPHVTLARCSPAWPRATVERFTLEVQGPWGEEFVAEAGVLYRSRLSPRGAQYEVLTRFPLRAMDGGAP